MKTVLCFALVGFAAAECPNACSGHGTCGSKDACSCYQNYQGNDCSERTCYFGLAHVDSPKGDLNADGKVSGPLTTVVTGSEVYPWGTTEQFPNANSNEGHFYMECSNKGLCDRKTGQCDCFDGYEGTACTRAACPNECSGHGTCESIKEFAELRSYDTNAHDVPATRVVDVHDFSSAIEESYSYDLWDADKTMGCKCDPVYYGADCSLKKCKYGVDPLFYDNTDGVIRQTTVVHVGSVSRLDSTQVCASCANEIATNALTVDVNLVNVLAANDFITIGGATCTASNTDLGMAQVASLTATEITLAANHGCTLAASSSGSISIASTKALDAAIAGSFKLVFYDVFGEKYVTKAIDAAVSNPSTVVNALQSLPNGVIQKTNGDVTNTMPDALTVSIQSKTGLTTTTGSIGAGKATDSTTAVGAGLGTIGSTAGTGAGPEMTITFNSNPGVLRSLEIDAQSVLNEGNPDYWVANSRQGQFSTRYTTNLGRINTLDYGSTMAFMNTDLTASVTAGASSASLVKVGGQEFRVAAATATVITLSEPFLGASITPILTDTGVTLGTATQIGSGATLTGVVANTNTFTVTEDVSTALSAGDIVAANIGSCTGGLVVVSATYTTSTAVVVEGGHGCTDETAAGAMTFALYSKPRSAIPLATPCTNCLTTITTSAGVTTITLATVDYTTEAPVGSKLTLGVGGCTGEVKVKTTTFSTNTLITLEDGHGCSDIATQTATVQLATYAQLRVAGVDSAIKANHFAAGSAIAVGSTTSYCSFTTGKFGSGAGADLANAGTAVGVTEVNCNPSNTYGDFSTTSKTIYRRSDDPTNQNMYKAPSDTGSAVASTVSLMLTRGSPKAYIVSPLKQGGGDTALDDHIIEYDGAIGKSRFKVGGTTGGAAPTAGGPLFVNGFGPMTAGAKGAAAGQGFSADDIAVADAHKFFPVDIASDAVLKYPAHSGVASGETTLATGAIVLLDGRRYKIKNRGTGAGLDGYSRVLFTENYAGGALQQICASCVAVTTAATTPVVSTYDASTEAATGGELINAALYDRLFLEDAIHQDYGTTVIAAATAASTISTAAKGATGRTFHIKDTADLATTAAAAASNRKALYKTTYGAGGAVGVTVVTVDSAAATYNYVSQCSNRGSCDASSGVCSCFKGYTDDACSTQNMLAL